MEKKDGRGGVWVGRVIRVIHGGQTGERNKKYTQHRKTELLMPND